MIDHARPPLGLNRGDRSNSKHHLCHKYCILPSWLPPTSVFHRRSTGRWHCRGPPPHITLWRVRKLIWASQPNSLAVKPLNQKTGSSNGHASVYCCCRTQPSFVVITTGKRLLIVILVWFLLFYLLSHTAQTTVPR